MKGDVIIVEEHHYNAANRIVDKILNEIQEKNGRYTMTVAGESGSGKSETAKAIEETLQKQGVNTNIFQQDDYYVYPPKTNDAIRRKDINWVGSQEVRLDLIDEHLLFALEQKNEIIKPLVIYEEDSISKEEISLKDIKVVIAQGTYTTLPKNVVKKVFINRNRLDARKSREKRNRAKYELDNFTEEVLKIEHEIISKHKDVADIIITKDYDVLI